MTSVNDNGTTNISVKERIDSKNRSFTGKIYFRLWIPAMISAAGLFLADCADSLFLGRSMGAVGLAAISFALPVFMFINVVMHSLGLGGSNIYAYLMGEGKEEEAGECTRSVISLAGLLGIIIAIAGITFLKPLCEILGAGSGGTEILKATMEYLFFTLIAIPFFFLNYTSKYFLTTGGHQNASTVFFTIGNILDLLLNFLLVMVLDLGAEGAGIATLTGQVTSVMMIFIYCLSHKLIPKAGRINLKVVFRAFKNGFSVNNVYIFQFAFLFLMNRTVVNYLGTGGVAIFDLIQNISYLSLYFFGASAESIQPLIATYLAEHQGKGIRLAWRYGLITGLITGGLLAVFIKIHPEIIIRLFGLTDAALTAEGIKAMTHYAISSVFAGICILKMVFAQSMMEDRKAFILSITRGSLYIAAVIFIGSLCPILPIWIIFPVVEILSYIISIVIIRPGSSRSLDFDESKVYATIIEGNIKGMEEVIHGTTGFCEERKFSPAQSYMVNMAIEEICTSIMLHGAASGQNVFIQITIVEQDDGDVELHIRDDASHFDPFSRYTERLKTNYENTNEEDISALGIMVIKNKSKQFHYRCYQGFNTIIVRV